MDIFADIHARVAAVLIDQYPALDRQDELIARITVEPPRDAGHGDMSTNAAMLVAKPLGLPPREVASTLAARLARDADIETAEVAGPGFLNFRLAPSVWRKVLAAVAPAGSDFGKSDIGRGEKVNVEYVSANPTGPMHVGHTRGAVFGDALAALMAFSGFDVTREYYINDAGGQVEVLAQSAYLRYREALGRDIGEIPKGLYPGDYLVPAGQALAAKYGDDLETMEERDRLAVIKPVVLDAMMELIRADLDKLGVHHDVFFSEQTLHGPEGDIARTLDWLRGEDLVYLGHLEPPKGQLPDDWEDREQTLFRAKQFGDDTDRALIKSDGSYTYFAADIAYHRNKVLRGFNHQIDVLGADHSGYVKRLQAAVKAVSNGRAEVDVRICQLVRLLRDGEPVKMSKRSGDLVTLADVVEEVGRDATRFMLLFRRNDAALDFDFAEVKEQSKDNPVFYVQYAHARACSAFRTAARDLPGLDLSESGLAAADLDLLTADDLELIRLIAQWPRLVAAAARAHEPHRIAFYLHELASGLHSLWAKGNQDESLRFVNADQPKVSLARLALVDAVRRVLAIGLGILGVSAPEELS